MNKLYEALKNLLPADQVRDVTRAIEDMMTEARAELETEFNNKLNEAYAQMTEELNAAESVTNEGYQQAYDIISDLKLRLESQTREFEESMDQGYEEAYQMLQAEQAKNNKLELEIYEEYESKLKQMKEFFVEKLDAFLQLQNAEIYEHARRDILNDPQMVEHKVAIDRIVDVVGNYLSEDDFAGATSARLSETQKAVEDLRGQIRVLEARNVRLSTQNTKLNESVREMNQVITEGSKVERKERARIAGNVSGRGQKVVKKDELVAEFNLPQLENNDNLNEGHNPFNDMLVLSGLKHDGE